MLNHVRGMSGPAVVVYLVVTGIFGVLIPWLKGLEFLDPVVLIAYACMGGVFAGPAVMSGGSSSGVLSNDSPRSLRAAIGRIAEAWMLGEAAAVIFLILGLLTVRLTHPGIFPFDPDTMVAGLALGAAFSMAMASMAAWLHAAYSAGVARSALRGVLVGLLIAFVLRGRWLPDVAWFGAAVALGLALIFLALLAKSVNTHRQAVET